MSKLYEAEFLTLDRNFLLNKNNESDKEATPEEINTKPVDKNTDWSKELQQRLDDNKKLHPEAQEATHVIEERFWQDFFNSNWSKAVALQLMRIDQLKKDIKKLGFKKQANPLLAFFKDKYVQEKLVLTNLINLNTYKVIHNAIAGKYIADSELLKANSYNIIYCQDLYKKPLADMMSYLKKQKELLPTNIKIYDKDRIAKNKKVFLISSRSVTKEEAKLRTLEDVTKILKQLGLNPTEKSSENQLNQDDSKLDRQGLTALVNKLDTSAKLQAALQFISMVTDSSEAKEAMQKSLNYVQVSGEDLIKATHEVSKIFNGLKLNSSMAQEFSRIILSRIKE